MSQLRSTRPGPTLREIESSFARAYEIARGKRPARISEDDLHQAALKWWRRVSGGDFPTYLLDGDAVSVDLLVWWMLETARECSYESIKKSRRPAAHGFTVVSDTTEEGDSRAVADPCAATLDETVIGRLDASEKIGALGQIAGIDPVVRYRALDFSYEEIGNALGVTSGAARVRMSRAASRLGSKLERVA